MCVVCVFGARIVRECLCGVCVVLCSVGCVCVRIVGAFVCR